MTATNHALSGAIIGLTIAQPIAALPLAFVSHFVLDLVPHFAIHYYESPAKKKWFHRYLIVDAALLSLIIGFLLVSGVSWIVLACVFLAGSPDFVQAYKYLFKPKFRHEPYQNHWFTKFHKKIQWSETEKGLLVEAPLACVMAIIVINILR